MNKMLLGLTAVFALSTVTPAFANEEKHEKAEKPAKAEKKSKKAEKKGEEKKAE